MPSTFTTSLGLELQATGENRSTWGDKANTVFELIEEAVAGVESVPIANVNTTLNATVGISNQARNMLLKFTGALTAVRVVEFPVVSKFYFVANNTTGGFALTMRLGPSGNTYTLNNGQQKLLYTDGLTWWTNDTLLTVSSTAQRWTLPAYVSATGFMEIGRYIDFHNSNTNATDFNVRLETNNTTTDLFVVPTAGAARKIWNDGNDGPGSGLDADTVDGLHANAIGFPTGTVMLFMQTAAPTGWTKLTTHNDKALRIVSGTIGTGGTLAFSAAFSVRTTGNTTLTVAQMPSHAHNVTGSSGTQSANHAHNVAGSSDTQSHNHNHNYTDNYISGGGGVFLESGGEYSQIGGVSTTGIENQTHYHNFNVNTGVENATHYHGVNIDSDLRGGGGAHNHPIGLDVNYVDVILATKN